MRSSGTTKPSKKKHGSNSSFSSDAQQPDSATCWRPLIQTLRPSTQGEGHGRSNGEKNRRVLLRTVPGRCSLARQRHGPPSSPDGISRELLVGHRSPRDIQKPQLMFTVQKPYLRNSRMEGSLQLGVSIFRCHPQPTKEILGT